MKITAEISKATMKMVIENNGTSIERVWKNRGHFKESEGEKHIEDLIDNDEILDAVETVENALVDIMDVI